MYKDLRQKEAHEVPDIGAFLTDKKDACDKDNDAYPVDDVRHYAYEGDGNSSGSLSSLASCTDDGDLKFNYLSNFGPRFRKSQFLCKMNHWIQINVLLYIFISVNV